MGTLIRSIADLAVELLHLSRQLMNKARKLIRFKLSGKTIALADPLPTRTLLEFRREELGHLETARVRVRPARTRAQA